MPLWAPFVLMACAIWFTTYGERRDIAGATNNSDDAVSASESWGFVVLIGIVALLIIWTSVYSSSAFLFDPRWLVGLLNDVLLLNSNFFRVVVIAALSFYFYWRGVRVARRAIEPGEVLNVIRIGVGVILGVILLRAAVGLSYFAEPILLLLIPIFLSLVLITHALAQAVFIRRSHPIGLQGSVRAQEQAILSVIGTICLILAIIALLVGTFASPAFLAEVQNALSPLGVAYDWLVNIVAYVIVFLFTPIFWLLSFLHPGSKLPKFPAIRGGVGQGKGPLPKPAPPEAIVAAIPFIKILLPLLFIVLIIIGIRLALRRRRIVLRRSDEDLHESVWSWELFWSQFKAFWYALWRRLFPERKTVQGEALVVEDMQVEPAARSIREIYRALLNWAAGRGYPRRKDETPNEFKLRLETSLPLAGPEVSMVTDVYTAIRYGGKVPDETEVERVQQVWAQLQQKS